MRRSRKQSNLLHFLLNKIKADKEMKEEMIYKATGGRSSSSYDLTVEECRELCNQIDEKERLRVERVLAAAPAQASAPSTGSASTSSATGAKTTDPGDRMRKKILSICHQLGMQKAGGKIDMARVNMLCCERGYLHKVLDDYTRAELPKLITQFEKILRDHLKAKG